jgi:hypothetical protein
MPATFQKRLLDSAVDFLSLDRHLGRGDEAQPNAITASVQDDHLDSVSDLDALSRLARQH